MATTANNGDFAGGGNLVDLAAAGSDTRVMDGLVTVRMDGFQAALWAKRELAEIQAHTPGELFTRPDVVRQRYVVEVLQTTRNVDDGRGGQRLQRDYTAEVVSVDRQGLITRLPWAVIERINRYKDQLQAQALSAEARERAEERQAMAARVAARDAER